MCDQLIYKQNALSQSAVTQSFMPKLKNYNLMLNICFMFSVLMFGWTVSHAQSFDQKYAEWKQKQQWHDQQFQQSNVKLGLSTRPTTVTIGSDVTARSSDQQVSLNQASAEQLQLHLTGIGQKKAQAIVDQRQKMGGFKRIEDLLEVKGIGEKTLEKNRHKLRL